MGVPHSRNHIYHLHSEVWNDRYPQMAQSKKKATQPKTINMSKFAPQSDSFAIFLPASNSLLQASRHLKLLTVTSSSVATKIHRRTYTSACPHNRFFPVTASNSRGLTAAVDSSPNCRSIEVHDYRTEKKWNLFPPVSIFPRLPSPPGR